MDLRQLARLLEAAKISALCPLTRTVFGSNLTGMDDKAPPIAMRRS